MNIQEIWCDCDNIAEVSSTGTAGKRLIVPYKEDELNIHHLISALEWWGYKRGSPLNTLIFGHPQDLPTLFLRNLAKATGGVVYPYYKINDWLDSFDVGEGDTITISSSLSVLLNMLNSPSHLKLFRKMHLKYILTMVTPPELKAKLHIDINWRFKDLNIIPAYGSVEMGLVGIACPHTFPSAYIHIMNDGLFHVCNQNNLLDTNGEGELVFTSLGRKSFPFIKYAIGDFVNLRMVNGYDCSHLNGFIRFTSRKLLTVKIPDAGGYFIDIFKIDEIIKDIIPGSQIICVYGENLSNYKLFLAIFIGIGMKTKERQETIKEKILEEIIINHIPAYKIKEKGISKLISVYNEYIIIFFINSVDIPKESSASKPKILLNLMQHGDVVDLDIYRNILQKLGDFFGFSHLFFASLFQPKE